MEALVACDVDWTTGPSEKEENAEVLKSTTNRTRSYTTKNGDTSDADETIVYPLTDPTGTAVDDDEATKVLNYGEFTVPNFNSKVLAVHCNTVCCTSGEVALS